MPDRYSPTERIGVNETERIVLSELVWIFRQQPIVDVGIDALIEQVEDSKPTGKFLAVQIKTGKSHFSVSKEYLTYYATNVHYNYWTSLDIPIILVAHIPESNETYWQEISKENFRKTRKGNWKIKIPQKQKFKKEAKSRLCSILSKNGKRSIAVELYEGRMTSESIFDANEYMDFSSETTLCINNINELGSEFRTKQIGFLSNFTKACNLDNLELKICKIRSIIKVFAKKNRYLF